MSLITQKLIVLTLFSLFLLSYTEKEQTYEELQTEVLCDILTQLVYEIILTKLPAPALREQEY